MDKIKRGKIEMTEQLKIELIRLENIVSRLWGSDSPSIERTITRAKIMLEFSNWNEKSAI